MQITSRINTYEIHFIRWMASLDSFLLNQMMIGLTRLGDGWLWGSMGLALVLVDPVSNQRLLLAGALASGVASLLFKLIKRLTGRPRPCEVDSNIHPIINPPDYYSFPSGHAINAFALTTVLAQFIPVPSSYVLYTLAFGIAVSRVYLRLHYPTDVLAGSILGYFIGATVLLLV
jgi:undecaprenyl-diphosphatase